MLVYIFLMLALSAIFSGLEIAFISASKLRVELKKQGGHSRGVILSDFYDKPGRFLGTTLVGNNITLVIFGMLASAFLVPRLDASIGDFMQGLYPAGTDSEIIYFLPVTLITTAFVLIFGEFIPKALFRLNAFPILYALTYPFKLVSWILSPIVFVMVSCSKFLIKLFTRSEIPNNEKVFTRYDLANYMKNVVSESNDEIDQDIFEKALYLKDVKLRECMIPRTEIEAVELDTPMSEVLEKFVETGYSKLIVYDDSLEEIKGYVHHQQMLKNPKRLTKALLPLQILPETMSANEALNKFILKRQSMGWVVDEFGGTAGIVTLEDILEEIFGEIEDEYDDTEEQIEEIIGDNQYRFSGRHEIDYLNEKYPDLKLPGGDYETLSGYIVTTTENIPKQGETLEIEGYLFTIEKVDGTKIDLVKMEPSQDSSQD